MKNAVPVTQGQTIAGKYQVERVIGEGGMGVVVAAWHMGLQQRVAIKFLLSEVAQDLEGAPERFRREARAAARIRSEFVCRVLDVGTLENGVPFMVMEYLEGCDLSQELITSGRPPLTDTVEFILQACEALAEAHVAGIVHRDLKPANLFLANRPGGSRVIKVLDFGVSKSLSENGISHLSLTRTSSLVGSPIYMSPEQIESAKDVDARSDIWALGTILYELATGRTPFDGQSIAQLVNAVLNNEPASFASLGVHAPAGFEDVVRRALAKKRDERYASVGELAAALEPFAPQASASVTRVTRVLAPSAPITQRNMIGVTSQEVSKPFRTSARRGRYAAGALLLLIPLIMGALYAVYSRSGKGPEVAQTGENILRAAAPKSQDAGSKASPQPTAAAALPAPTPTQAPSELAPSEAPAAAQAPSEQPSVGPAAAAANSPATRRPSARAERVRPTVDPRANEPSREPSRSSTQSNPSISDFGGRR